MNDIPNSVDKLKKFITNFVERPALVPGGCPPLNSSIDSDDGGPALPKKSGMGTERLARLPPVDHEKWIKKGEVARMSAQHTWPH